MKISEARGRLPELAKFLEDHPHEVVLVEHRDLQHTIALTTEGHIRYLETTVKELKKQASRPFKLAGSIASALPDEELDAALRTIKDQQARLLAEKLRAFAS